MPWRARTPGVILSLTVFAAHIIGGASQVYWTPEFRVGQRH